jgi:hypothetical protein
MLYGTRVCSNISLAAVIICRRGALVQEGTVVKMLRIEYDPSNSVSRCFLVNSVHVF